MSSYGNPGRQKQLVVSLVQVLPSVHKNRNGLQFVGKCSKIVYRTTINEFTRKFNTGMDHITWWWYWIETICKKSNNGVSEESS